MRGHCAALLAILALLPVLASSDAAPARSIDWREGVLTGRMVPDIALRTASGGAQRLSDLWRQGPVLVTFFYRRCAGICTPFLEWVRDALQATGGPGREYRVVALSFDEADTIAALQGQAAALGLRDAPGWTFAITGTEELAAITGAVDFWQRRNPTTGQYDHDALLVAIDGQGRVLRAVLGGPEASGRLRNLGAELRGTFVPFYRVAGGASWRCFAFDPATGRSRLDWGMLLLLLPALCAVTAALLLFSAGASREP
ncbi:MAG: hypothetical protein EPO25_07015 [Gammaproteobacteria bacterium]|nr:MAG: hypothetical protein EPO25_07015 [Gammaproteobacteria bacterium]